MDKEEKKDLAQTAGKELANAGEFDYLKTEDVEQMGTDNIDQSDLKIPRLKIVQALTKQKWEAVDGEMINSMTGINLGKSVVIIPIVHWKSLIMFDKTKVICRSLDGKVSTTGKDCINECGKCNWGDSGKPECSKIYNYLIAIQSEMQEAMRTKDIIPPLVLSFMGTSVNTAKVINTNIKLNATRKFPIYSQTLTLFTPEVEREFDTGKAYIPEVKVGQFVSKEEFEYLKAVFNEFSQMKKVMNVLPEDIAEQGGSGKPVDDTDI